MPSQIEKKVFRIALIVNPYAGIGGEAALKGSDQAREAALAYSSQLRTPDRTHRFLQALADDAKKIEWLTGSNLMGAQYLAACGITPAHIEPVLSNPTSADDTKQLAQSLLKLMPDVLVFVGGDGTARDMVDSVGLKVPVLGVPGGVKMQSGVFAISPEAAANIVKQMFEGLLVGVAEQDVRDIDEIALREGKVRSRFYGSLQVPAEAQWLQRLKEGAKEDESLVQDEIAEHLTEIMHDSGRLMLAGPGSGIARWMASLNLPNTLIGFDAILNGELIQSDLTANDIRALIKQYPDLYVVITPTGHQGFLLGRGNQQLAADIIKQLDKSQWLIVASQSKLQSLQQQPLLVDTNDAELDRQLAGFYPVITAWHHQVLYPISHSYGN